MLVSEAVGRTLVALGVDVVFGVMGSGNLAYTNAMRDAGASFCAARHEGGAVCMADGYARVSARLAACSVHQGPGLTNTITGLTEAAKSRTPLLVLAADTPAAQRYSNFRIEQDALVAAVGAVPERVHGPATAVADVARAVHRARSERRAVVLMLPLDVQAMEVPAADAATVGPPLDAPSPAPDAVARAAALLAGAQRPAIIAGRGAALAGAGPLLRELAERTGAILATSAVANGLFDGDPFAVGISGGFSSPVAARLLQESDVVLAFGAALNQWTTRHGTLLHPQAQVVQVDLEPEAIGIHRPVALGVVGDAAATAAALLDATGPRDGRRTPEVAAAIAGGRWRDEPYDDAARGDVLDPRSLSIALDDMLPAERTVVVDSGHFMGWPSMYLRVPDAAGFVFPQAFQCVGLGLGNAIGAAIARPDRLTVAALGDGGLLMALPELETLGRLGLPLLVVVYDDAAYGAEVHHFRPQGQAVDLAQFPATDFAALAEAAGCRGLTARTLADLDGVRDWLVHRDRPLVLDAKIDPDVCAEWLEEAFRGH
ncbi:MAG TPA: thiamine pyrophosphate-binding protein [Baekduia sp.]|uniref:thiamine pyrophosphate-binding protein n=1 Tax=Baekduia sp. TaxID=2600305 RepID=UPI002CB5A439|nr:thiamine pyrophosphate-binding protein [Baekduia sp.]HMJ35001.1 thiamine pyrophosphate-binding protein [Baekduia sp.]